MDQKVIEELQKLSKLLALNLTKDLEQSDSILLLNKAGFQPAEIAQLINSNANVVSVTLNRIKKKKDGKR